jgi:uncharacterized cupredoxin-like copper-binding protein
VTSGALALAVATSTLAVAIGSPASAAAGERPEITVVAIVATEGDENGDPSYRFELPVEVPAGPVQLSLLNNGDEPHHAQLFKLAEGATVEDLSAALADGGPEALAELGVFAGGTALVDAGERSEADAVVALEAGRYVLLCFVPAPDGSPSDAEVALFDYAFTTPRTLDGDDVLTVTNEGTTEPHEMIIGRLHDDATFLDVRHALEHGDEAPATFVGGMQALPPGATAQLRLDLEAGRYVLICEIPSPDGTPHHVKGMIAEVTVT